MVDLLGWGINELIFTFEKQLDLPLIAPFEKGIVATFIPSADVTPISV